MLLQLGRVQVIGAQTIKEQKKEKYKAFGNEMLFLIPTKHKYLNSLVTSSTQQNEFWVSKHQSMTLKHSMNINSYVATQN